MMRISVEIKHFGKTSHVKTGVVEITRVSVELILKELNTFWTHAQEVAKMGLQVAQTNQI